MTLMSRTLIAAAVLLMATPALAGPVTLKANPVDDDGQVTFGDIFDGAGPSASVVVARRSGPSVVMEAGQLQSLARQSGLDWDNPRGLRRVVIRNATLSPAASAASTPVTSPRTGTAQPSAPAAPSRPERVIARNDIVQVVYIADGGRLTFILSRSIGDAFVARDVDVAQLRAFLIAQGAHA